MVKCLRKDSKMRKNLARKRPKRMMLMTKAMIVEMSGKLSRMMRK